MVSDRGLSPHLRSRILAPDERTASGAGDLLLLLPDLTVLLMRLLRETSDEHECVMIIGHNPTLEDLVELITGAGEIMPTAAVAHIELDLDSWRDLGTAGTARLTAVWRPKELPD